MKKLLITGGAGFIGSHCVIEAVSRGYEVVNLDALTYAADLEHLKSVEEKKNYRFAKGDIRDREFLKKLFQKEKFDCVLHLAAESHVDFSIVNPNLFVETNVLGSANLLECSKNFEVKKFVQVSTDEVYGSLAKTDKPFTENSPIRPNSPYSASKAGADFLVRSYVETFGLPACVTRCSNNFGPHQDSSKLIPVVIGKALSNKKIPIYGKGENVRDWLFVHDHVSALFTVLEKGKKGEIYNVGGNNEKRNIDLVKQILKLLKKPESLIEFVTDRKGHDLRYAIDSSKIKKELGWKTTKDFNKALEETISYYRSFVNA